MKYVSQILHPCSVLQENLTVSKKELIILKVDCVLMADKPD